MLEGLEISIKSFRDIEKNNPTYRIDSEFYKKEYMAVLRNIFSMNTDKLQLISKWITQGPNPIFSESNIPCLTGRNISNGRVNYDNADYVSEVEYENLKRFQLKKGDTLITLKGKGSIGKIGYVTSNKKAIFSRDIGIIRPSKISSAYVNAYILSYYGSKLIERGETGGTGQSTLTASYIKNLDIVRLTIEYEIGNLILNSEKLLDQSKQLYTQAENILLEEIGLQDFVPSKEPVNIKSFSESFGTTGRIDAEYYQKKYEELNNHIENYCRWDYLKKITTYISNGNQPPYSESGTIRFFSQKWIKDKGIDYSFLKSKEEPMAETSFFDEEKNKPSLIKKGDILYYSVGANLGFCHNYLEKEPIAVGSFINIIRADKNKINELYLGLIINSLVGRLQGEKQKSGVAQPYIYAKNLREFKIPIIEETKQLQIAELIEQSFTLKKQSEQLLEVAKKAVEIAIEQNEAAAMEYIAANS